MEIFVFVFIIAISIWCLYSLKHVFKGGRDNKIIKKVTVIDVGEQKWGKR